MPLTDQQEQALQVLDWFADEDSRMTGRSFIQAVALIRAAARNPGRRVLIFDHFYLYDQGHSQINRRLLEQVASLVQADVHLRQYFQVSSPREAYFWFQRDMNPVQDWRPSAQLELPLELGLPSSLREGSLRTSIENISQSIAAVEEERRKKYPTFWDHLFMW